MPSIYDIPRSGQMSKEAASEFDDALSKYQAGLSYLSPEGASDLYLKPIAAKWNTIGTLDDEKVNQADNDFTNATQIFQAKVASGFSPSDAAQQTIAPVIAKWHAVSPIANREAIFAANKAEKDRKEKEKVDAAAAKADAKAKTPMTAAQTRSYFLTNPVMQHEEQAATDEIENGTPIAQAIDHHPTLIENLGYKERWLPRYLSGIRRDQAQAVKEGTLPAFDKIASTRARLLSQQLKEEDPEIQKLYGDQISSIEDKMRNVSELKKVKVGRFDVQPAE